MESISLPRNFLKLSSIGVVLCCLGWLVPNSVAQAVRVEGVVRDSTGASVTNAAVTLHSGSFSASTTSDAGGRFVFIGVPHENGSLAVQAKGFALVSRPWNAAMSAVAQIEITLQPSGANERVVVSAARAELRLAETPGSAVSLSDLDVASTPALMADDVLRQVPGFSLFRRSDSRTANPTAQGVSLRGLGASGTSRALVLEDGIPLLDPFGGWVYWDRIPVAALSSVEVFRGGASNLYGSDAMGGVVQFITRQAHEGPAITIETSYGNEQTPDLSVWSGTTIGNWDLQGSADLFHSDGYILVPKVDRGSVDVPANSEHAALDFSVGHRLGSNGRVFVRGNYYNEARENGTTVQTNDTRMAEGSVGIDKQFTTNDSVTARVYGDVQGYNQSFSSIASTRNSEALTDLQHVPAQELGSAVQWTHALGKLQTLVAGADLVEVMGASDEHLFSAVTHLPTAYTVAGGRQRTLGLFAEDIFRVNNKWTIIVGGRFDHWSNFDAQSVRTPVTPPQTVTVFPDRSANAFSPRLSVLRSLTRNVSLTASMYRAFRAPTLNELYRSFRQGNTFTESNAALRSEQLTGAEAGLNVSGFDRKLDLRGTFFWSDVVDPDENVTLCSDGLTPPCSASTPITRLRQNLGRTRSRGVELDGTVHLSRDIQISGGYDYTEATVVSVPGNPVLLGLDIPQVPRHEFTWEARYWNPSRLLLSVQGRFVGTQFDDDQNTFPLNRFYVMDVMAGRSIAHGVQGFVQVENILDERYTVALTPVANLGPPVLFRVGLRYDFPREKN
jgi:outer membrane receptor protein involved in Fe transport